MLGKRSGPIGPPEPSKPGGNVKNENIAVHDRRARILLVIDLVRIVRSCSLLIAKFVPAGAGRQCPGFNA